MHHPWQFYAKIVVPCFMVSSSLSGTSHVLPQAEAALWLQLGGCMELFMINTGFYDK